MSDAAPRMAVSCDGGGDEESADGDGDGEGGDGSGGDGGGGDGGDGGRAGQPAQSLSPIGMLQMSR